MGRERETGKNGVVIMMIYDRGRNYDDDDDEEENYEKNIKIYSGKKI